MSTKFALLRFPILVVLFKLVGLTLVACSGRQEEVLLEYPLSSRLTYFGTKEIFVSSAPDVPLERLCDLKDFGSLRPGMTVEQAGALYGPPISMTKERKGQDTVYAFSIGSGRSVEVIRQMAGSEEPLIERWVLRQSASGKGLETIVAPEVLAAIPVSQRDFTLHLDSEGKSAVRVVFQSGRPFQVWWLGDGSREATER